MLTDFHRHYLDLVENIESDFSVAQWRWGDVDIWPLARMDLYLDMYAQALGSATPRARKTAFPAAAFAARPAINFWKSRHDVSHLVIRPRPAHAILLGDGVSLDRIGGCWQDRFGEPIVADLETRGFGTFLMQAGSLARLPWRRPTFAANVIERLGVWRGKRAPCGADLPDHHLVMQRLAQCGVETASLTPDVLTRRAAVVSATASGFERVLRMVRPKLAFVVTYYAGLGPAFMVACRRQGILSVDLQHCPQERAHKAYRWTHLPENGYTTLPAVFWNWTQSEACGIEDWTRELSLPWHCSLQGGHSQLTPFLGKSDTTLWDAAFRSGPTFEREVLVALQPIPGHRQVWDELAKEIENAPASTRWWIRRHPASHPGQDVEFERLLSLRLSNVEIERASEFPLPALLRHCGVVISLASGAAVEASMFGVPAFFLSESAHGPFSALIARGGAKIVPARSINDEIARLPPSSSAAPPYAAPPLEESIARLEDMAERYAVLCRDHCKTPDASP